MPVCVERFRLDGIVVSLGVLALTNWGYCLKYQVGKEADSPGSGELAESATVGSARPRQSTGTACSHFLLAWLNPHPVMAFSDALSSPLGMMLWASPPHPTQKGTQINNFT